jgi:hypothetical protein
MGKGTRNRAAEHDSKIMSTRPKVVAWRVEVKLCELCITSCGRRLQHETLDHVCHAVLSPHENVAEVNTGKTLSTS